ncbi:hypothetical protein [Yersinia pseudotuberculosis]|uniref:hypothetical protein n=1 Tax=Yersinia pseudotuberculosis TaxID=633 RepID=UPI001FB5E4EB|nr:hypothetical protein [Yersinia pseudotuberculosis]
MIAHKTKATMPGRTFPFQTERLNTYSVGVCPEGAAPRKASESFVQTSNIPRYGYNRVALDGKWLYVYADHINKLTKKRHRLDGVRVQGYTAKGLHVEVLA